MLSEKSAQRVKILRDKAVEPIISYDRFFLYFFSYMRGYENEGDFLQRYVKAYQCAFEKVIPCIDEGELIVGKMNQPLSKEEEQMWEELKTYAEKQVPYMCGQDSHMAVDYDLVLRLGLAGIRYYQTEAFRGKGRMQAVFLCGL